MSWGGVADFYMSLVYIADSDFSNNMIMSAGGAIHINRCNITIQTCYFSDNTAINYGGALNIYRSTWTAFDCHFLNNKVTSDGGAIHVSRSEMLINSCSFINNDAFKDGGAVDSWLCTIIITGSIFYSNVASQDGGAIKAGDTNVTLCHTQIQSNIATYGGGINAHDSNMAMTGLHFVNNTAHYHGGALYTDDSNVTVVGTILINNSAINGGGLYTATESEVTIIMSDLHSNIARDRGGAIVIRWQSTININETNIFNNTASWGTSISNCNGQTDVYLLQSAIDPVYTYCTTYDGFIDNFTIIADNKNICNTIDISFPQLMADTRLHILGTYASALSLINVTTTVILTVGRNSCTSNSNDKTISFSTFAVSPVTTNAHITIHSFTEIPTALLDLCSKSNTDAGYIVAIAIVTLFGLILLGYVIVDKVKHQMTRLQTKQRSCNNAEIKNLRMKQYIDEK